MLFNNGNEKKRKLNCCADSGRLKKIMELNIITMLMTIYIYNIYDIYIYI